VLEPLYIPYLFRNSAISCVGTLFADYKSRTFSDKVQCTALERYIWLNLGKKKLIYPWHHSSFYDVVVTDYLLPFPNFADLILKFFIKIDVSFQFIMCTVLILFVIAALAAKPYIPILLTNATPGKSESKWRWLDDTIDQGLDRVRSRGYSTR
jgi:hypothetical protein